jgi:hypothetical protein
MTFDNTSKKVNAYLEAEGLEPAKQIMSAAELESHGWHTVLMTLMPDAFEEEFSDDHVKFWDLGWSVLLRLREQQKYRRLGLIPKKQEDIPQFWKDRHIFIHDKEMVVLLILGRGLAKSSTIEAFAVIRACILGGLYCLYVCESQDQAEEHVGNIKGLIDDEDSRVIEFYPHMEIDPNAIFKGKKTKDRADLVMTKGGAIYRAKGLNASLRGLRILGRRPDLILLDDVDGVNDSIPVSVKKAKQITSSVIPTQARRDVQIMFGQNLILETGVMNLIHSGKIDALAERTTIGVTNTFVKFEEGKEYQTYFDEADGRIKHRILPTARPTWAGVDMSQAQKFLNDSGLPTFLSEYMNQFEHLKTEKVFHEWNEARHVIIWSMFEAKFGVRHIPGHWRSKASADIGYSKNSLSAWGWWASAAQNSPLPSLYFGYRSRTYTLDSIDDQAVDIWEDLFPDHSIGKRHFEATQVFNNYPELFRLLKTKPRCKEFLERYAYNTGLNKFELKPFDPAAATDEDKKDYYVNQAQKTYKSQIQTWVLSHEKSGERLTLAQKYGLPIQKVKEFGADAGVSEANHLLRGDYTRPHPFYEDEIILDENNEPTGIYKLGRPYLYIIVDDDQIKAPRDDRGWKTFRSQVANQVWTEEKLTELGLTKTIPLKFESDHCDEFRMFATNYAMPASTKLEKHEEFVRELPPEAIVTKDRYISPEQQMSIHYEEELAKERLAKQNRKRRGFSASDYEDEDE